MHKPLFSLPCLSVCLSVCVSVMQHYSKCNERIMVKNYGGVPGGNMVIRFWLWSKSPCCLSNRQSGHFSTNHEWILMAFSLLYIALHWYTYELIEFVRWSGSPSWLSNLGIWAKWRYWAALAEVCALGVLLSLNVPWSKFDLRSWISLLFVITWTSNSYHVVNYFHWPWLVTLGGNRNKCVK